MDFGVIEFLFILGLLGTLFSMVLRRWAGITLNRGIGIYRRVGGSRRAPGGFNQHGGQLQMIVDGIL